MVIFDEQIKGTSKGPWIYTGKDADAHWNRSELLFKAGAWEAQSLIRAMQTTCLGAWYQHGLSRRSDRRTKAIPQKSKIASDDRIETVRRCFYGFCYLSPGSWKILP